MGGEVLDLSLHLAAFVAVGALAGFAAGVLRSGAGLLVAPMVLYALEGEAGGDGRAAIATALAANLLLSLRAAVYHGRRGSLDAALMAPWAAGAVLGGLLGGAVVATQPASLILGLLAVALVAGGLLLPLAGAPRPARPVAPWLAAAAGAALAAVSAASGAGGGSFIGAAWRWRGLAEAAGHAALCGVLLGVAGLVPLMALPASVLPLSVGAVSLPGAVLLAAAASVVAPHGARLGAEGPRRLLVLALAFVLLSLGFALLRTALAGD